MASIKTWCGYLGLGLAALTNTHCAPIHSSINSPSDSTAMRIECRGDFHTINAWINGSFNHWNQKIPLERKSDGLFVGYLHMPEGRNYLMCELQSADGNRSTEPPLNSPQLEDDGFGSQNGVFEIPVTLHN